MTTGETKLGQLKGRIVWEGEGVRRGKAVIRPMYHSTQRIVVGADVEGVFSVAMPIGSYTVQALGREKGQEEIDVQVAHHAEQEVTLLLPPPQGHTVSVGRGRTSAVGPGLRKGLWQTFGVPDGLPSAKVYDIAQDSRGHLWIGTNDGLSRYDGETFTTFTTKMLLLK